MPNLVQELPRANSDFLYLWITPSQESTIALTAAVALLVGAILCVAIFVLLYVSPVRFALWRKARWMRRLQRLDASTEALQAIHEVLAQNGLLKHCWIAFRKTLGKSGFGSGEAADPQAYFNPYVANVDFTWVSTFGVALLCLGFLVSFGAVTTTLVAVLQSVTASQPKVIHAQELFGSVSIEFYPVFAGVTALIFLKLVQSWGESVVARGFYQVAGKIGELLPSAPKRGVWTYPRGTWSGEGAGGVGEHTAIATGSAMSQRSGGSPLRLEDIIDPVTEALRRLEEQLVRIEADMAREPSSEALARVEAAIDMRLRGLSKTIEDTPALHGRLLEEAVALRKEVTETTRQLTTELREMRQAAAEIQNELTLKLDQLRETSEGLKRNFELPPMQANSFRSEAATRIASELKELVRDVRRSGGEG